MKFCNSHLTHIIFNLYMWRFFFCLVYGFSTTRVYIVWNGVSIVSEKGVGILICYWHVPTTMTALYIMSDTPTPPDFLSYLSFWKVSFPATSASLVLVALCPDSWRMLAHRRPSRETVDIRILSLLKCIVLIISVSCFRMAGVGISFVLSYMNEQRITRDFRACCK